MEIETSSTTKFGILFIVISVLKGASFMAILCGLAEAPYWAQLTLGGWFVFSQLRIGK